MAEYQYYSLPPEMNINAVQQNDPGVEYKKRFSRVGFACVAMVGIQILIGLALGVVIAVVTLANSGVMTEEKIVDLSAIATAIAVLLVAYPIGLLILRNVPKPGFSKGDSGGFGFFIKGLCVVFGVALVGDLFVTGLDWLFAEVFGISLGTATGLDTALSSTNPLFLAYVCVLGPIAEEFIFRKQIIDRVCFVGEKRAILISALIFCLMHMNLVQLIPTFLVGCVLGWIYLKTRKLIYVAIPHIINNTVSMIITMVGTNSSAEFSATNAGLMYIPDLFGQNIIAGIVVGLFYLAAIIGLVILGAKAKDAIKNLLPGTLPVAFPTKSMLVNGGMMTYIILCGLMIIVPILSLALLSAAGIDASTITSMVS